MQIGNTTYETQLVKWMMHVYSIDYEVIYVAILAA